MRLAAWMLIVVSLVVAIVAAVTAYSPRLSLPDAQLVGLTLNAPAGKSMTDAGIAPIATKGTSLTGELLEKLRAAGEQRVRVKEFSLRRWSNWWMFLLGCAGMFVGAMIVRRENARRIAGITAGGTGTSAGDVLRDMHGQLRSLQQRLATAEPPQPRQQMILEIVGKMIAEQVPSFVAARPVLVAQHGLAGYAQLMDRFAAGERKLNRAWSAAADGYLDESIECLDLAAGMFDEAREKLSLES